MGVFDGRTSTCKQRLQVATERVEQSFCKLMAVLDREPMNYTPVHIHHGVSLVKMTDLEKR